MYSILPEAKVYQRRGGKTKAFNRIGIEVKDAALSPGEILELLEMKLWNYPEIGLGISKEEKDGCLKLVIKKGLEGGECGGNLAMVAS